MASVSQCVSRLLTPFPPLICNQVHFDKITERIRVLVVKDPPIEGVDPVVIAQKVIMGVYAGVTTKQLDMLAMETAAALCTVHPGTPPLAFLQFSPPFCPSSFTGPP